MSLKLNTASGGSITLQEADTASNLTLTVPAQAGSVVTANSSGNVGIGTNSPSTKLTIASSSYQDHLLIDRTGVGSMQITASNPRGLTITDGTNAFLQIVQSNGSVGIGTSSPISDAKLTISSPLEPILFFQRSDAGNNDAAIHVTSGGAMLFKNGADSSTAAGLTERMRIDGSGALGFSGANYGTSGQVLTSGGSGSAPSWASVSALGVGQSWTNVGGSRSSGTTYTNSTGKPIQIMVCTDNSGNTTYGSGGSAKFYINGNNVGESFCSNAANIGGLFQAVIPNGSTYQVSASTIRSWWELR